MVIELKVIVNANSRIGEGGIVLIGAVIDHDVQIGYCCHINASVIIKAGEKIEALEKPEAGEFIIGVSSMIVN